MYGASRVGTLVEKYPYTVLNVRRDEWEGTLDWSFLIVGTFELDKNECERGGVARGLKEHTRWVSFGITDNGGTGFNAAPAALDWLELHGAHADDMMELRSNVARVVAENWEAVESASAPGTVWFYNPLSGETTWEAPSQGYWDWELDEFGVRRCV